MLLPYTPELDPIPQAMVMRVFIAARLNLYSAFVRVVRDRMRRRFLGLPWRLITPQP